MTSNFVKEAKANKCHGLKVRLLRSLVRSYCNSKHAWGRGVELSSAFCSWRCFSLHRCRSVHCRAPLVFFSWPLIWVSFFWLNFSFQLLLLFGSPFESASIALGAQYLHKITKQQHKITVSHSLYDSVRSRMDNFILLISFNALKNYLSILCSVITMQYYDRRRRKQDFNSSKSKSTQRICY